MYTIDPYYTALPGSPVSYAYLLTLFPNDPTAKFSIKNLPISIAIPTIYLPLL